MKRRIHFEIRPQPDDMTCGPTCLHALYAYYGDEIPLSQVIAEVPQWKKGGTLAVLLACHALTRGYSATIYSYNMRVFDPTWFESKRIDIKEKLRAELEYKERAKLRFAIRSYLQFVELGGEVQLSDLKRRLIYKYLQGGTPILTGLSATYLFRTPREYGPASDYDDLRGEPSGHFVVLCGYDKATRRVLVADPLYPNPMSENNFYEVNIDRLICSILLGVLTYDANLLIIQPPEARRDNPCPSLSSSITPKPGR
jgi:hypothetical protein